MIFNHLLEHVSTCLNHFGNEIFSWASLAGPSPGPGAISPACGRATTSLQTLRKASANRSGGLPAWDRASVSSTKNHQKSFFGKYVHTYTWEGGNESQHPIYPYFPPMIFHPQTFPPHTFHPETLHPEILLAHTFHPETLHPETLHQETLLAHTFHPETLHPETLLAQTFHPETFIQKLFLLTLFTDILFTQRLFPRNSSCTYF